jgi:hypothetical protein
MRELIESALQAADAWFSGHGHWAPFVNSFILLTGVCIAFLAWRVASGTRLDAKRRARNQLSFDMIRYYIENRDHFMTRGSLRNQFYTALPREDLTKILERKPISISPALSAEYQKLRSTIAGGALPASEGEPIDVGRWELLDLRIDLINFMNSFEYISIPYSKRLCNRDIFYEEMRMVILPQKQFFHDVLKSAEAVAAGHDLWPSFKKLLEDMERRSERLLARVRRRLHQMLSFIRGGASPRGVAPN